MINFFIVKVTHVTIDWVSVHTRPWSLEFVILDKFRARFHTLSLPKKNNKSMKKKKNIPYLRLYVSK